MLKRTFFRAHNDDSMINLLNSADVETKVPESLKLLKSEFYLIKVIATDSNSTLSVSESYCIDETLSSSSTVMSATDQYQHQHHLMNAASSSQQ